MAFCRSSQRQKPKQAEKKVLVNWLTSSWWMPDSRFSHCSQTTRPVVEVFGSSTSK
jgi:hypothetical protein